MAQSSNPRLPVSVVVPSRDRPAMLDRCLASLRNALRVGDELVVVDSASVHADAVARVAAEHGARLVRCDEVGVNRARNAGWTVTTNQLVLFTDDDVEVATDWADAYARAADAHPEATFFTGWIGARAGQETRWLVAMKLDEHPALLTPATRGTIGHGASLGVRRTALVDIGGWDEAMGSGGVFGSSPETDLFDRLFAAGGCGWYVADARAWHDQWRGIGDMVRLQYRYGIGVGARIAKLMRTDRGRAAVVARDSWWTWGLQSLGARLRHLDKAGALTDVVRIAGYVVGFARAITTPVRDGHYVVRSARRR